MIGIGRIIVPRLPGLMSARGILSIDVRHDLVEPLFQRAGVLDPDLFHAAWERLEARTEELRNRDSSITEWRLERSVDVRYFGQISGYLNMALANPAKDLEGLVGRFEDEHAREFGYRLPHGIAEVEVVSLRGALIGEVEHPPEPAFEPRPWSGSADVNAHFPGAGRLPAALVDRDALAVGERVEGPAIITEWASTTVVPPAAAAVVQAGGELSIELEQSR